MSIQNLVLSLSTDSGNTIVADDVGRALGVMLLYRETGTVYASLCRAECDNLVFSLKNEISDDSIVVYRDGKRVLAHVFS